MNSKMKPNPKGTYDALASIDIVVPDSVHIPHPVGTVLTFDGVVSIVSCYNPDSEMYEVFFIDSMSWCWVPVSNLSGILAPPSPKSLGILCMFKDSHP